MKLSCALVACNENPHYLQFWPYVKRAWWEIVGIPCVMVYIGQTLPDELKDDPAVIPFASIEGWPTATQAQVIRLLYPALLKCDGAVVLSDMDIIPVQKDFFVDGFQDFSDEKIISLRGIDEQEKQIYMCYVGATPSTWAHVFNINTVEDVRTCLESWSKMIQSDGKHGGQGWCTDQHILYNKFKQLIKESPNRVGLLPWISHVELTDRLDRANPVEWYELSDQFMEKLKTKQYVDFHMPPLQYCEAQLEYILSNYM
jgi:hypothetical protein